jgi:hypothetical protein
MYRDRNRNRSENVKPRYSAFWQAKNTKLSNFAISKVSIEFLTKQALIAFFVQ